MPFVTSMLSTLGESQQHDAFQVTLGIWISLHLTEYEYGHWLCQYLPILSPPLLVIAAIFHITELTQ